MTGSHRKTATSTTTSASASKPKTPSPEKATYNYETTDTTEGELPGLSVFYRNEAGDIFHTYSTYARGLDILVGTYNYLDLTPKGRNEDEIMDWVRHHDKYEEAKPHGCCHS
nr:hypothetical protein GCM10020185_11150 [Pseudomonas brassicacearum subsp. brassicacearum]